MRFIGGALVLATGDLTKYVRCEHATFLDYGTKSGAITPLATRPPSALVELIADKGDQHEHAYVETLRAAGKRVMTIGRPAWTIDDLRRGEADTLAAMRSGADSVVQAVFFDGQWNGYADVLERVERPSALGGWSYEVIDTKLARAVKPHFLLQLADYSAHLARMQGLAPERMHLVLGTGKRVSFEVDPYAAYHRHVRASVEQFVRRGAAAAPYPVEFCALCEWSAHCWRHWNDIDHLSLVANIRRTQVSRLEKGGLGTLTALGEASPRLKIRGIPEESFAVLNQQARLQLEHRRTGEHKIELLPRERDRGFLRLPRPSSGDVFLDVEGDPFVGDGLTYLFGAAWEEGGESRYAAWWAHDAAEELASFQQVIDFLVGRRTEDPGAHVYHYGAIEVATLKRLMGRYGTRERELDDLLRQEVFVDLSAVVRQAMRISHSGYGLKKVETFYFEREAEGVADAGGAVLAYEQWLETNDPAMLAEIGKYNGEDCLSLLELRKWLIEKRPAEVEWRAQQEVPVLRQSRLEEEQQNDALYQPLLERLPLLAHLLYYHRREERPAWWSYFERQKMTPDELLDDSESIAGLRPDEDTAPVVDKKSKIFTYRFPPQEHKFDPGDRAFDASDGDDTGTIVAIEDAAGMLRLRRGPKLLDRLHPEAIIPKPSVDSASIRAAIRRFAGALLERDVADTRYRAGADMLLGRAPRITGIADGEPIQRGEVDVASMADVVSRLDHSYLFVQGPPGSGKTYLGARVIVGLLRAGKRVGVASNSHAAVHNLLAEVEKVASAERYWFRGLKKCNDAATKFVSKLPHPMIESTTDAHDCADHAIPLVAGTAWLFADDDMDQSLDYIFIDEAGQVSLANATAVSTAARNVVLLGDPLQLAQVSQGSHPDGAGASVLEHLLGRHATVPRDRGLFLEHTWRMHPDVCAFVSDVVYDSRLRSADACRQQAVTVEGVIENGLRFIAVEHEGNSQSSDEEAQRVAVEIRRMVRGTFTDDKGVTVALRPADFLVVAAYNAQVRHITAALAGAGLHDVPVGTVDKFQGKQAPVVFFSMATSSGAELPRDIDFLFSRNRLNVAISRARCVATIVASPRLLDVACRTPEQMQLVNGLCRFVEMARPM